MKKAIGFIAVATTLALTAGCGSAPVVPAEESMLRLHIDGKNFVNEKGDTVFLHGLCFSDPSKLLKSGHWNEGYFKMASEWGANIVRFAVHPVALNQMGWDSVFTAMDQGIEWAKENNLYVIMDWHSIGNLKEAKFTNAMYNTTIDETFAFWRTVAARYADEPTVALYEVFNEPVANTSQTGDCTWEEWKDLQEQIIDTIRAYNPEAICLCAGFNWAYDLTAVAEQPIGREQVAYVSHPYPMKRSQPWEEQWERDWGYVADTYPVVCTELGYCLENERGSHIPVIGDDVYGDHITKYMEQKGINYTIWCFDPDWGPMLIDDWDYTPTTQGRFFKAYLQSMK